ncbi:hypothetical protein GFS31_02730 [Leptolyngbya sp. BL0902]|nr:hypothetical protein GFS31_02730 [Leptolyngbya sp. BL0902]
MRETSIAFPAPLSSMGEGLGVRESLGEGLGVRVYAANLWLNNVS